MEEMAFALISPILALPISVGAFFLGKKLIFHDNSIAGFFGFLLAAAGALGAPISLILIGMLFLSNLQLVP